MFPSRHSATAWERWIFCPTDHLNFENLQNRRRYHNPGKPRTAGLCGREVVASDHLPLSSTFFGWPKSPDLPHKTSAAVPLPMLFSLWRYHRKTFSPTSAHTGRTRPVVRIPPPPPKPHTALTGAERGRFYGSLFHRTGTAPAKCGGRFPCPDCALLDAQLAADAFSGEAVHAVERQ